MLVAGRVDGCGAQIRGRPVVCHHPLNGAVPESESSGPDSSVIPLMDPEFQVKQRATSLPARD